MAKLTTVFIGVLVVAAFNAELRFTDAGPVPELTVKLLCELLCEHCNGVPNMESGHCNCQVPEAHFKDNAACLKRAQISAAEMNLKLTHSAIKNNRRKRSFNESYKRDTTSLGGTMRDLSQRLTEDTREHPVNALPEPTNMGLKRDTRSTTKDSEVDINKHKGRSRREMSVPNDDAVVDFRFDADITIPMFPYGRVNKENSPPKLQGEVDSHSLRMSTTEEPEEPNALALNKLRSDTTGASIPEGNVLSGSSSLYPETKPGLLNPTLLSSPTFTSQELLRTPNDKTLLQMNKLNDLKLKLPTLLSKDQSRSPFHSFSPLNKLLKGPMPLAQPKYNTPLTNLELLNPLSKPLLPPSMSQNKALNDLFTKTNTNRLTLAQPEIPLLERIRNYQSKLRQRLSESRSAGNLVKPLPLNKCLFARTDSGMTPKFNLLSLEPTNSYRSIGDCDDDSNLKASPTYFLEKTRSKLRKAAIGDKKINNDILNLPLGSDDLKNNDCIPTASPDDLSPTLPNKLTLRIPEENIDDVNRNKETTKLSQSTENTTKDGSISKITSPPIDLSAHTNVVHAPTKPTANHSSDSDYDQHSEKFQQNQLETTPSRELAPSESTTSPEDVNVESPTTQTVEPSPMKQDAIQPLLDHPHFLNHNDDSLSAHHFPSLFFQPTLPHLSPEERYRALYDPIAFQNAMQQIHYPALLARNDLSDAMRGPFQNIPMVLVPNSAVPFDHPSRAMIPYNPAPDTPINLPHDPNSLIMNAYIPGEHPRAPYPSNPAILSPSSVFVMSPLPNQVGNIPYPDLLNQLRAGNAIVQIHPIDLEAVDK